MKTGIKRIGKGLFAIFMIKLIVFSSVLIFQSCQKDETVDFSNQAEAKANFLDALYQSNQQLRNIAVTSSNKRSDLKGDVLEAENTHPDSITTFKMCLLLNQDDDTSSGNDDVSNTNADTLGDVYDIASDDGTRPVLVDNNDDIDQDPVAFGYSVCFQIPAEPTMEAMELSINEAKNYLYSHQMNDNDIVEILDGEDEANLVPLVMALVAEEEYLNNSVSYNYFNLFGQSVIAQDSESDLYDCALRSIGITALTDVFNNGLKSAAGKQALKKAIRKIAARTLGWVGAAWAAYEFGDCMNWW